MNTTFRISSALFVLCSMAAPSFAQSRLVNMVPNSRSGETNQDAEPTITVDPHHPHGSDLRLERWRPHVDPGVYRSELDRVRLSHRGYYAQL